MSWENDLAQEFTKRNNKSPLGAVCGTVEGVDPLIVSILGGSINLTGDRLYLCSNVLENVTRGAIITLNGGSATDGEITYKNILKVKDKVLCLPADGGRTFFIIDKVV